MCYETTTELGHADVEVWSWHGERAIDLRYEVRHKKRLFGAVWSWLVVHLLYIYIYVYIIHIYIYSIYIYIIHIYIYNHHPFKATFQAAPYQNVRYIFWDPPLNVKLVAERPPGVVFVGSVVKIPSKCKLTFSRPPQKQIEQCSLHFGHVPPEKGSDYIYIFIYMYMCTQRESE